MRKIIVAAICALLIIVITAISAYRITMDNITVYTNDSNSVAWLTVFGQSDAYEIDKGDFDIRDYNK